MGSYEAVSEAVKAKLVEHEAPMFKLVDAMDKKIAVHGSQGPEIATDFSYGEAEKLHDLWTDFYGELFMTYVDGYKTTIDPKDTYCGCQKTVLGWDEGEKAAIVARAHAKYHIPDENRLTSTHTSSSNDKLSLRSLGGKVRKLCREAKPNEEEKP